MPDNPNNGPDLKAADHGTQAQLKTKKVFSLNFRLSLILGLLSLIVYANTLRNAFALDDAVAIRDNKIVREGIGAIPTLLATPYHYGWSPDFHDNLYRPLSLMLFAAEYQFFQLDSFPYHLFNIFLFACCVIALFLFLDKLFQRRNTMVAFIAALLFAMHPIHTEVVANVKSADELLCFLFSFLCLNVLLRYAESGKMLQLLAGTFCFLLALLSKETAITFLLVIPLIFFFYRNENKKRSVFILLSIVSVAAVFLVARFVVFNHYYAGIYTDVELVQNALANKSLSFESHLATAIFIYGYYVRLLFFPYPLICDYSYNSIPYSHFSDPLVWCAILIYVFLIVFSVIRLRRYPRDLYAFGILFFLLTISLFSNVLFLTGAIMAERFLFFGSVGFCLIIALLINKLAEKTGRKGLEAIRHPVVAGVLIVLCMVYSFATFNRNKDWKDNYTLCVADIEKVPDNVRLNEWLSESLMQSIQGETDKEKRYQAFRSSLSYLDRAVSVYPDFVTAHCDLGSLYLGIHKYDSAERHFLRAYELNPKDIFQVSKLANIYFMTQKYRQAITFNQKAIELKPDYAIHYANTASCYLNLAVYDTAIAYANKAAAVDRSFKGSYQILALAYKSKGVPDSAQKYEAIARGNRP
jgi:protein O-mannosyl-transferase